MRRRPRVLEGVVIDEPPVNDDPPPPTQPTMDKPDITMPQPVVAPIDQESDPPPDIIGAQTLPPDGLIRARVSGSDAGDPGRAPRSAPTALAAGVPGARYPRRQRGKRGHRGVSCCRMDGSVMRASRAARVTRVWTSRRSTKRSATGACCRQQRDGVADPAVASPAGRVQDYESLSLIAAPARPPASQARAAARERRRVPVIPGVAGAVTAGAAA